MTIYLLLYGLVGALAALRTLEPRRPGNATLLMVGLAAVGAVIALRAPTVGTDTRNYLTQYDSGYIRTGEDGFNRFVQTARDVGLSFQMFVSLVAAALSLALYTLIVRMSLVPLLSLAIVISTGLFAMAMSGIRQALAVTLFMAALALLNSGHRVAFVGLVFAASTFHSSAIVLVPIVFLARVRISRQTGWILFAVGLFIITQGWIVEGGLELLGLTKYDPYLDGAVVEANSLAVVFAALVPLACLLLWPQEADSEQRHRLGKGVDWTASYSLLFVLSIMSLAFVGLGSEVLIVTRMSYYFAASNAILVSNVLALQRDRELRATLMGAAAALAIGFFWWTTPGSSLGISEYSFFWAVSP